MSVLKVNEVQNQAGTVLVPSTNTGGYTRQPGQIIEWLTHSCDGTTMYGADERSYTWPNVTTTQDFGTSYVDLTGSSITYTPPTGTKTVYYKFVWMFEDEGNSGISHYKFMIDSDEVTAAYTNLSFNYATNAHGQSISVFEYTIDCAAASTAADEAKFTSWTSNKTLKIQAREYSTSYKARAHYNQYRDGTTSSSPYDFRRPTLTIAAIA